MKILKVGLCFSLLLAGCAYFANASNKAPVAIVIPLDDEVEVEFKSDMEEDKDTLHNKRNKELIKDEEKEDDDK